jgi:ubiquinone/menaquinone biosynthesis C-methylase UbiE
VTEDKESAPDGEEATTPFPMEDATPSPAEEEATTPSPTEDTTPSPVEEEATTAAPTTTLAMTTTQLKKTEDGSSGDFDIPKIFEKLLEPVQYVAGDTLRVRYAVPQVARVAFFLAQGVTLSAIGITPKSNEKSNEGNEAEDEQKRSGLQPSVVIGALQDALLTEDVEEYAKPDSKLAEELSETIDNADAVARSLFAKNFASIISLLRKDLKNIEDGEYKLPYDLEPQLLPKPTAGLPKVLPLQQWNPLAVAKQLSVYVKDRKEVLDRMTREDGFEVRGMWKSKLYPDYFLQNFHYQGDGWLSSKSARLYDYQVESLFLGNADAMRRQVMPEFNRYIKRLEGEGRNQKDITLLDTATGTGRFASFVLDNNPDLNATVMDLSPFYLEEARRLLRRFKQVDYMQAAVEDIPADEDTYDAITCVYLFHELPREVRREALKEFFRTLKPGGKLFFVDSAQKGEVPYDRVLKGFTIIAHEPYYIDYSEMDLKGMMEEVGFQVESEGVHWVTKSVVAHKPLPVEEDVEADESSDEEGEPPEIPSDVGYDGP